MNDAFLKSAHSRYLASNAATLRWMLDRPRLADAFLNTKMNPLTLEDYGPETGWRGPQHVYGWIQGRGLEAVFAHASAFRSIDDTLCAELTTAGRALAVALDALRQEDGHVYFAYDLRLEPVRFDERGEALPQARPEGIFTYSDIFAAKGLIAAAAAHDRDELPRHLSALELIIDAIENGRFQMDEKTVLSEEALSAEPADFGPRMIMLGAAGLLKRSGCAANAGAYADRFIAHVIDNHFDPGSSLLRNVPGQDACNVGHAIEFVGFGLDYLPADADRDLIATLERILRASFELALDGPGLRIVVSAETGQALSPFCPWWSLPETIRSAALCYERTGSDVMAEIWKTADRIFFDTYWRPEASIAFQCLTDDGPVDYVPATPDLDPGYHTGLSLLAAIDVIERRSTSHSE